MLTLFLSRTKKPDINPEPEEDHLTKDIAKLWDEVIRLKDKEKELLDLIKGLEIDLAKVSDNSEAQRLIKNSLAQLRLELLILKIKPEKQADGDISAEADLLNKINNSVRSLTKIQLKEVTEQTSNKYLVSIMTKIVEAKLDVAASTMIESRTKLAVQQITQQRLADCVSSLQHDNSTIIREEYVDQLTISLNTDFTALVTKVTEEIAAVIAEKELRTILYGLEDYVNRAKVKASKQTVSLHGDSQHSVQTNFSILQLEKVIKICKYVNM